MSELFVIKDPSLESQWRSLILFGKNSATYKFAFAKSLLEIIDTEQTHVKIEDLAKPFADNTVLHLKKNDKQGTSSGSQFLKACRDFINNEISQTTLYELTTRHGFKYVIDAFQIVNGNIVPNIFYEKDSQTKSIIVTDNLLKLKNSLQYYNFDQEVEARWQLVETAWNLNISANLLQVEYDIENQLLFLENNIVKRAELSSVRDALNGYQKGKCFYSNLDISIVPNHNNICHVDHFIPFTSAQKLKNHKANINGVWNLVLANKAINLEKQARIPHPIYLEKLFKRNEFYIESKHPLGETIANQTGQTKKIRKQFLQKQYNEALDRLIHKWQPSIQLPNIL